MELVDCMKCGKPTKRTKIQDVGSVIILGELPKSGYCPNCFQESFRKHIKTLEDI